MKWAPVPLFLSVSGTAAWILPLKQSTLTLFHIRIAGQVLRLFIFLG